MCTPKKHYKNKNFIAILSGHQCSRKNLDHCNKNTLSCGNNEFCTVFINGDLKLDF